MYKFFIRFTSTVLIIFVVLTPVLAASIFPDVPDTHPNYHAIQFFQENDIIQGYSDGTFQPDKLINRAETLKIILETLKDEAQLFEPSKRPFPDVSTNKWYAPYVTQAKELSIIHGNSDGTFTPDRTVNKAELLKMVLLAHEINTEIYKPDSALSTDVDKDHWFSEYFNYSKKTFIISTDQNDNLNPGKFLNRAEVSQIIYNFLLVKETGIVQALLLRTENNLKTALNLLEEEDNTLAIEHSQEAIYLCQLALNRQVENEIIISACSLSKAFQAISEATILHNKQEPEEASIRAQEAKDLATEASQLNENIKEAKEELIKIAEEMLPAEEIH